MAFSYSQSVYFDPPSNAFAEGYAALLINSSSAIYTEVSGEQGKALPALASSQIFVGKVSKEDPKLLTIECDYSENPTAQYLSKLLNLNFIIRAGLEGTPAEQSIRSAGYISVVTRLTHALTRYNGFMDYLLDAWPAQLSGESVGDYANRKQNYHKKTGIELQSITGLPSNAAAVALSGYEGGCRVTLQISSALR